MELLPQEIVKSLRGLLVFANIWSLQPFSREDRSVKNINFHLSFSFVTLPLKKDILWVKLGTLRVTFPLNHQT